LKILDLVYSIFLTCFDTLVDAQTKLQDLQSVREKNNETLVLFFPALPRKLQVVAFSVKASIDNLYCF
jgi:hypothetical protein